MKYIIVTLPLLFSLSMKAGTLQANCDHVFVQNPNAVVSDKHTGLTWSACLLGQSGNGCHNTPAAVSWVDALNQARGSELAGITHWRLPKIDELEALFATGQACVSATFPSVDQAVVWSASANLDYATDAWAFDFNKGEPVVHARDSKLQVLLVSGP